MWFCIFTILINALLCTSIPSTGTAPRQALSDGNSMPTFGIGTWLGLFGVVTDDSVEKAVEAAIDAGYRHIDTAYIYHTEDQVGRAINKKIKDGVVSRDEMFVTTKLWNDKHAKEDVVPALKESLAKLNLDYVDLYLIHWPFSTYPNNSVTDIDYLETWQGMVEAKKSGLAKSIGVCNFNIKLLDRLFNNTDVKPVVLQVEVNLSLQQDELREYARDHNMVVMGYTPFGSLFSKTADSKAPPPRVDDPKMVEIAKKYGKTVPQIVLRYLYELGVVPIPKTTKKERVIENIDIFDFELSREDKELLKTFDKGYRSVNLPFWRDSKYYPFEKE